MSDDLVKRLRESGSRSEVELHEDREDAADRIEELEAENHLLKTSGIIEVAVRNPNVMEYMRHWEGRAEAAENKMAKAVKELEDMQKVPRSDASYGILMVMIKYTLAELKG